MIIALTGTPGTGKTSISRYLEKKYRIIDVNKLITEEGLHTGKDEVRGSYIADMDAVSKRIEEMIKSETGTVIIEGHLSHHLECMDAVIVLRTRPSVLAKRLEGRGYYPEKVRENIEAEALDVILTEAVEMHSKVYEFQTTNTMPYKASVEIKYIIEMIEAGISLRGYQPGRFDWSEEVFG